MQCITPCLWFNRDAEEAVRFYSSIFKNSGIRSITRYGKEGHEIHGMPQGAVLTVEFELSGQRFTALNGGPAFTFNEAVSFPGRLRFPGRDRLLLGTTLRGW